MGANKQQADRALVVREGERRGVWFLDNYVEVLATGDDTEGRYALIEVHGAHGDQPPLHSHHDADEAFFVLEGELEVWAGPTHATLRPGDYVLLPKQVPHCYLVTSRAPARWLMMVTPAGFEQFMLGVSRPADEARIPDPSPPPTPEQLERFIAAGVDIGEYHGPPGARP